MTVSISRCNFAVFLLLAMYERSFGVGEVLAEKIGVGHKGVDYVDTEVAQ
jgi:hypothetical protein